MLLFAPPAAHLLIQWTKILHDSNSLHLIQTPSIHNIFLCPIIALLTSRPLPPSAPLFANNFPPYTQVIDTHVSHVPYNCTCFTEHIPCRSWVPLFLAFWPHLHLTTISLFKIPWHMAYGAVLRFGPTSTTPYKPLLLYLELLTPLSPPISSLALWF